MLNCSEASLHLRACLIPSSSLHMKSMGSKNLMRIGDYETLMIQSIKENKNQFENFLYSFSKLGRCYLCDPAKTTLNLTLKSEQLEILIYLASAAISASSIDLKEGLSEVVTKDDCVCVPCSVKIILSPNPVNTIKYMISWRMPKLRTSEHAEGSGKIELCGEIISLYHDSFVDFM